MPDERRPGSQQGQMLMLATTPPRTPLRVVDETEDDAALVEAIAAGNASRAVVLYDRLRPVVSRTIRRLAPRSLEHEDLVQQAFVELVVSLKSRPQVRSLDAWAATVSARTVYQRLRRARLEERFAALEVDPESDESPAELARGGESPHAASVRREALRKVLALLSTLNQNRVQVFVLHDVHGFELKEIADILGITVANAQSRLVRGRGDVHAALADEPELKDALSEEDAP